MDTQNARALGRKKFANLHRKIIIYRHLTLRLAQVPTV
jgi:hypothetical protein